MTDRRTVFAVVVALAALTAIALLGTIVLLGLNKPADMVAVVSGLAGTGMGALAALLVSTRSSEPPPP